MNFIHLLFPENMNFIHLRASCGSGLQTDRKKRPSHIFSKNPKKPLDKPAPGCYNASCAWTISSAG